MKIKLFDYHVQTVDHGDNKPILIKETIESAINYGLDAICLTDHYPLPDGFADATHDDRIKFPDRYYMQTKMRKSYINKIKLFFGAEIDWLPEYEDWIIDEIKKYPFDYIIGSVHFLGKIKDEAGIRNFCHDYSKEEFFKGLKYYGCAIKIVEKYFSEIRNMIKSDLFDCVGHLDLIKKFNDGGIFSDKDDWYRNEVSRTLDLLKQTRVILELNTAGLDNLCNEQYPSNWILKEAKKRNIQVTLGSDAHEPNEVGRNFDRALETLRTVGYKSLVRFEKRKKIEVKI